MKKLTAILLVMLLALACVSCGGTANETKIVEITDENGNVIGKEVVEIETYNVGICQYMKHPALDDATRGFKEALTEAIKAAGKAVNFEEDVAGEDPSACNAIINTYTAKNVDLIMANATPALTAAATATTTIPVLGTSVTDYENTFGGKIPANVSGTSDAVPFDEQAKMMIETLGLVKGDKVGVIYCTGESNSLVQYEAVKALFDAEGIVVEAYTFSETTELQAITGKAADECKAIYIPSDNTVAANEAIVGTICSEKKIPVYASYGGAISYASLAIDYYELGRRTGEMAAEILLGTKTIADIKVETLIPTKSSNKEICDALGITIAE
ncbi:MAG: ABC transporter substrate-binding protein [Clostridia bacterium]|nr:ABC transporter substrate-binding protein [Clostridia bacterium]